MRTILRTKKFKRDPQRHPAHQTSRQKMKCMFPNLEQLRRIANAVRTILEENKSTTPDICFQQFPRGACGATSELLGRYLLERCHLAPTYVEADLDYDGSHAWISVGGIIIDITADQFGKAPVIVSASSAWHEQWDSEQPRTPNCHQANWSAYPATTWCTILEGMKLRGFA